MTYTKPPWKITLERVRSTNYGYGLINNGDRDIETAAEANRRLMEAAPELLEACKEALHFITYATTAYDDPTDLVKVLRYAIEKAEGKE